MDTILEKTITHFGSQSELAKQLGIKPQAVQQWKKIPPKRALRIEELSGGVITAMEILQEQQG